jgi:hypothetical protein
MNKFLKYFLLILLILILINIFYRLSSNNYVKKEDLYNLEENGYELIHNFLDKNEIQNIKELTYNKKYDEVKQYLIKNKRHKFKNLLSDDYVFQDYIMFILKSNIHTCHRDNNGSFYNKEQKHNSYTILIFLEPMDRCLDVIPKSHTNIYNNSINFSDYTKSVPCTVGDALIFDANLIHTGSFNKIHNNPRVQMKLSHKDDLQQLFYFQNYNKLINKENKLPNFIKYFQKNVSCTYPIISNNSQKSYIKTINDNYNNKTNNIPLSQKIFSYLFYGDSNYYDLPDIQK